METALVLVLEDSAPFDAVRRDFAVEQVARGIPFHITLLYPFAPREQVTESLLTDVRSFFSEYRVDEATLLEEFEPERWRERERFALGG